MEISSRNAFRAVFPRYEDLLNRRFLHTSQEVEQFVREELPAKVQIVRKMEVTFTAFINQYTNLIIKRPQQANLIHSLINKANERLDQVFKAIDLQANKMDKYTLAGSLDMMNFPEIRTRFRERLASMDQLIKEKYIDSHGMDRQIQEEVATRLYNLLELYHFTKSDLATAASKYRLSEAQILEAINSKTDPSDISSMVGLDSAFADHIKDIVSKRCRPFINKRDFFSGKLREISRETESKVGQNFNILIDALLSKEKYRISKEVLSMLQKELQQINSKSDEEVECKQIMIQVDELKKQFNRVKNNAYFIDIMRGNFCEKYKMELNKLQNLYYLSNLEKYLQDVTEFLERVLRAEERIITNRKLFTKNLGAAVQGKIDSAIEYFREKTLDRTQLQSLMNQEFQALQSSLYGVISAPPKAANKSKQNDDERRRKRMEQAEERRRKMQEQRVEKQRIRKIEIQRKQQEDRRKREEEKIRMEERRKAEQEKMDQLRRQKEQKQKTKRIEQEKADRERRELMAKKEQERKRKEEEDRIRRQQDMRKKQAQKAQAEERQRIRKQNLRKQKEEQQKKIRQQAARRKEEQENKKRIEREQADRKKQEDRKRKEEELKRKQQQQAEKKRKLEEQRIKKQQERKQKLLEEEDKRKQKQAKEKQEREQKQKQERERKQAERIKEEERKKEELRIKEEKRKKEEEQKQRKIKEQEQKKKQKAEEERKRKQKQEQLRRQEERKEAERKKKEEEDRKKREKEEQQRKEKELEKQREEERKREQKRKEEERKKEEDRKKKEQMQAQRKAQEEQQKARKQKEEEARKKAEKKNEPKKSAINYGDFGDLVDQDDPQDIGKPNVVPAKNQKDDDQYLQEYEDDFDDFSPDKEEEDHMEAEDGGSGEQIQTKQLIDADSVKALNEYLKGTSFSRKNKLNLELYNNKNQYMFLFEEFVQNRKLLIFETSISKGVLDFSLELLNEGNSQQDLQISLETILEAIEEACEQHTGSREIQPRTKLVFPFSFENDLNVCLIEVMPHFHSFHVVLSQAIPNNQQIRQRYSGLIEAFLHLFSIEADPNVTQMILDPDSKAVLSTVDKQLPNLLILFAMHYEKAFENKITINQYTFERFFYCCHVLEPLYKAIEQNEEIALAYEKIYEKFQTDQKIKIQAVQVEATDSNYEEEIGAYSLKLKEEFLKGNLASATLLTMFQILIPLQEDEQQMDKVTIYVEMTRSKAKPILNYYIISKDDEEQENASKMFQMISNDYDDQFETSVFIDFTRHNGPYEYSDWTLPLWAHMMQKRKLTAVQAFRALTMSMAPYYITFKQMD